MASCKHVRINISFPLIQNGRQLNKNQNAIEIAFNIAVLNWNSLKCPKFMDFSLLMFSRTLHYLNKYKEHKDTRTR